ncbi:hypothetical protein D7Z26_10230 [Cohnella endophytica]|uniref:Uncharacterized protein n=1 Tax=Cohnella endophytica TaxID=2419778 RepID=A0A494Y4R9_9BACL|nr:hypothetical protein [Cohnella endophytica]RKP55551.1 hypothetical protein D7Z26_10230 [Cohnella endophytica]
MKIRILYLLLSIIVILVLGLVIWNPLIYKFNTELLDSYEQGKNVLSEDWYIVTSKEDFQNLDLDNIYLDEENLFNDHFVVISKYKIKSLYYWRIRDDCACGPPYGEIKFDKKNSKVRHLYIYQTERKWIYQATGL